MSLYDQQVLFFTLERACVSQFAMPNADHLTTDDQDIDDRHATEDAQSYQEGRPNGARFHTGEDETEGISVVTAGEEDQTEGQQQGECVHTQRDELIRQTYPRRQIPDKE